MKANAYSLKAVLLVDRGGRVGKNRVVGKSGFEDIQWPKF
jgi:hypothetical protein